MYKIFLVITFLILFTPLFNIQAEITAPPGTTGSIPGTGAPSINPPATDPNCPSGTPAGSVCLTNPLGTGPGKTSIPVLLGKIISSVLGVIGSLALVMFIYGGAIWMLSAGNQEQVTKGKNILIWATLGIVIIFTAYALVKFVLTTVTTVN